MSFYVMAVYHASSSAVFYCYDTATTGFYPLSLHDALPIFNRGDVDECGSAPEGARHHPSVGSDAGCELRAVSRSEEHTSELQSLRHLVCRLLLEKKNKQKPEKSLWRHYTTCCTQRHADYSH